MNKKLVKCENNVIAKINEKVIINNKRMEDVMKILDKSALTLVIIGAINWGLIGFFKFNLVDSIFGEFSIISRIIYALVGIAGLYCIKILFDKD